MDKHEKIDENTTENAFFSEDELLEQINSSLAEQVNEELGIKEEIINSDDEKKKKLPKWFKITSIVMGCILAVVVISCTVGYFWLDRMHTDWSNEKKLDDSFEKDEDNKFETMNPDDIKLQTAGGKRHDPNVINILLVGEEAMGDAGARGRTDSIMIASVNIKQKAIKLTSLMRDTYVQIPGYSDNKLNSAYHHGGIPLLYTTIENNFGVALDGSVLVNFDGFEKIIDKLGGVEITLSGQEARYLNRTNYISNPAYRNVIEGTQTLNGNQALGFSRIRYVSTADNVRDDFGRTSRQRTVLNAVFEKYKSKSLPELISLMNDLIPMVKTDIKTNDMVAYLTTVVTLGVTKLDTFRYPMDNCYKGGSVRGMSVLIPDIAVNNNALHEFIFGVDDAATNQNTDTNLDNTNSNLQSNVN